MDAPEAAAARRILRRGDLCWIAGLVAAAGLIAWELETAPRPMQQFRILVSTSQGTRACRCIPPLSPCPAPGTQRRKPDGGTSSGSSLAVPAPKRLIGKQRKARTIIPKIPQARITRIFQNGRITCFTSTLSEDRHFR